MKRVFIVGLLVGILTAVGLAPDVSAAKPVDPGTGRVTITTAKVDRAGNAIIDFTFKCDTAVEFQFGVGVNQFPKKGAKAYGGAGSVWDYFCLPGTLAGPADGDQFVVNGALLIQPGTGDTESPIPSGPFAPGYATVGVNIFWTDCTGATTMEECWDSIALADDPETEDVEGPPSDAFWTYQVVKLVRAN